jgi:hypothetical protein
MEDHRGQQDATELIELDRSLRNEAVRVLDVSGLGAVLRHEGYQPVGSFTMRTMTWRDLDFERVAGEPDWDRHWRLGTTLAGLSWVWQLSCINAYRKPGNVEEGLYWGLRLSDPKGGPVWKVDLWTARQEEFARGYPDRSRWETLMTEDARVRILAIKKAVCGLPQYRRDILSVDIYRAVLDEGVNDLDQFMAWAGTRSQDLG